MSWCSECGVPINFDTAHKFSGYGFFVTYCSGCCPRNVDGTDCDLDHPEPVKEEPMAANDYQVGGSHYRDLAAGDKGEQHWDMMWRLYREAWFIGCITKYVLRYRRKHGIQDLEKAMHYLMKLLELEKAEAAEKELASHIEARESSTVSVNHDA